MKLKMYISILLSCVPISGSLVLFSTTANAAPLNGWISANGTWYYN